MIAPKTKPCFNCKKPEAVYNWNDLCPLCQRAAWVAEEKAILTSGNQPWGFLPAEKKWDRMKGDER